MKWLCPGLEYSFSGTICCWHHVFKQLISLTKPTELYRETQSKHSMTQKGAPSLKLHISWISGYAMNTKTCRIWGVPCFFLGFLQLNVASENTCRCRYFQNKANFVCTIPITRIFISYWPIKSASYTDTRPRFMAFFFPLRDIRQREYKWRLGKCMHFLS